MLYLRLKFSLGIEVQKSNLWTVIYASSKIPMNRDWLVSAAPLLTVQALREWRLTLGLLELFCQKMVVFGDLMSMMCADLLITSVDS